MISLLSKEDEVDVVFVRAHSWSVRGFEASDFEFGPVFTIFGDRIHNVAGFIANAAFQKTK